jgi:hypothetical protein
MIAFKVTDFHSRRIHGCIKTGAYSRWHRVDSGRWNNA